jgi:hypothetical protein
MKYSLFFHNYMELLFKDAHNVVSKKNDRINNVNPEMIILRHSDVFFWICRLRIFT